MKIKEQYLDTYVRCPLTSQDQLLRFLDINLYNYYSTHGYSDMFEEDNIIINEESTEEDTNDIPESGN